MWRDSADDAINNQRHDKIMSIFSPSRSDITLGETDIVEDLGRRNTLRAPTGCACRNYALITIRGGCSRDSTVVSLVLMTVSGSPVIEGPGERFE